MSFHQHIAVLPSSEESDIAELAAAQHGAGDDMEKGDRNPSDGRTQEELDLEFALTLAASQEDYLEYERTMFGGHGMSVIPLSNENGSNGNSGNMRYSHVPYSSPGGTVATPKRNPMAPGDMESNAKIFDSPEYDPYSTMVDGVAKNSNNYDGDGNVGVNRPSGDGHNGGNSGGSRWSSGWFDDLSLARTLQAMEFEIDEEMRRLEAFNDDFNNKEYSASSCRRQMLTLSTFIVFVQVLIVFIMLVTDGIAPSEDNPMIGPPGETLVIWGAKEGALIKYSRQWWRTISPVFLHAGILHVGSNGFIQLRVGGYLNRVYGTWKWMVIYFTSGVFGNMCSCIFLPDNIGVGSSGAVLGMLSSWIIWIIFRWKKIPRENKQRRNCQLTMVTVAVVVTLATSFAPYVDFAAHFGGSIMGLLMGGLFLSEELDNVRTKMITRGVCIAIFITLFVWATYYLVHDFEPQDNRDLWENNDDWSKHGF